MARLRLVLATVLALAAAVPAVAQDVVLRSPVVTLDQERLFTGSAYGQAILGALEAASQALAAENRQIEADLSAEEKQLTADRPGMDPVAFHDLAAAFDDKVVAIRKAQDEKSRALVRRREAAQQEFFSTAIPILTEIVRERGAVAVLERGAVILSAEQIDITDAAIARIDARLAPPETATPDDAAAPSETAPETQPQE